MGVRMIVSDRPGESDRVALYDSVSGWAFGPVFPNEEDAQAFLDSLPNDARSYSTWDLGQLYSDFVETRRDEPTDDELYNRPGVEGGIAYPFGPENDTVLGPCVHGIDLDREFCPEGCRV